MALPTSEELRTLSSDTGHPAETPEVTTRLLDVLQAIADDPVLHGRVVLKGGTALNGFYSDWPRLSLDIDLAYIGPPDWDAVQAARPEIDGALRDVLVDRGYEIRNEPLNIGGGKRKTAFEPFFAEKPVLEIDLG